MKPGALIIAAHYASAIQRHERSSQDVLPSVIRGLSQCPSSTSTISAACIRPDAKPKLKSSDRARSTPDASAPYASHTQREACSPHGKFCAGEPTHSSGQSPATSRASSSERIDSAAMIAEALAHTPLSRDNKRARLEREGGTSPAERTPAGQAGAVEFVSRGEPCLDYLTSELAKHAKSADIFQHQRTELSKSPSGASQRSSGPTTPRLGLPHSPNVTCEQPADGSQARSTRPPMSGPSCSPLRLIQTDLCGND
jgi:hypothetical protein